MAEDEGPLMLATAATVAVAYLGAGVFYALCDTTVTWPEDLTRGLATVLAILLVAILWAPTCAFSVSRYASVGGWRPALAFVVSGIAPTLAIFIGGLLVAL